MSVYDFKVKDASGKEVSLDQYKGQVLLIVNVASECGFTPQYDGLQALNEKYRDRGLVILGFPCNQFKEQEPGTNEEIQEFCRLNYGVDFPVMAKIDVNGESADPLYQWLKEQHAAEDIDIPKDHKFYDFFIEFHDGKHWGKEIPWNFSKFLIDKNGQVVGRYASAVEPAELEERIEKLL